MLIGKICPESRKDYLHRKINGEELIYKTVQLDKAKEISYLNHPILMVQPRRGTISMWKREKRLLAIFNGEELPRQLDSLDPSQMEILCHEYLRLEITPENIRLKYLLMPIGRTLPNIDIIGIGFNGKKIYCQVTYERNEKEAIKKLESLKNSSEDGTLIFFGLKKFERLKVKYSGIIYKSIEDVFKEMDENPVGSEIISNMLNC